MTIWDVALYQRCNGAVNVIGTFRGGGMSEQDARCNCVDRTRSAGRLSDREAQAITSKIRYGLSSKVIDVGQWCFTVERLTSREV